MKNATLFIFIGFITIINCHSQNKSRNGFGNYYQIGDYGILAPFAGKPNISPSAENSYGKCTSYQYAYPNIKDDSNMLYGIDILEINIDSIRNNIQSRIKNAAKTTKLAYKYNAKGKKLKEEESTYHNNYCIYQKLKIDVPNIGEVIVNSLFISYKDVVVRIYTFSTNNNDDNSRINKYYEAIKLE